jgi:lambda repressor-like predicted transcriptional regulator
MCKVVEKLNEVITADIRNAVRQRGITLKFLSAKSEIEYARLQRIFNTGAGMLAGEFLILCRILDIRPEKYMAYLSEDATPEAAGE